MILLKNKLFQLHKDIVYITVRKQASYVVIFRSREKYMNTMHNLALFWGLPKIHEIYDFFRDLIDHNRSDRLG